jgi:prevent-host-death family protein
MNMLNTVQAREHFSDLLNRVAYGKERIIITRRERDLAVVIPIDDLQLLEKIEDYIDILEAYEALEEANTKGTISLKDLKKELGL